MWVLSIVPGGSSVKTAGAEVDLVGDGRAQGRGRQVTQEIFMLLVGSFQDTIETTGEGATSCTGKYFWHFRGQKFVR